MDEQERPSIQNDPVLKAIIGDPSGPIPPEWMNNANDYSTHQFGDTVQDGGRLGSWVVIFVSLLFLTIGILSW